MVHKSIHIYIYIYIYIYIQNSYLKQHKEKEFNMRKKKNERMLHEIRTVSPFCR